MPGRHGGCGQGYGHPAAGVESHVTALCRANTPVAVGQIVILFDAKGSLQETPTSM
jgi:hypothetical protein